MERVQAPSPQSISFFAKCLAPTFFIQIGSYLAVKFFGCIFVKYL